MLGNFSCFCCRLLIFSRLTFSKKNLSGTLTECQTGWIQIRAYILSVLFWVLTLCKGYQQKTFRLPLSRKVFTRSIIIDSSSWFDTINLGWSIVYIEGSQVIPQGGGYSIFSAYVGSDPASTVHPKKNIRNFKHPKNI